MIHPQAAQNLVSWVRDLPVHVNLIQLNVTDTFSGEPSSTDAVDAFIAVLDHHQIPIPCASVVAEVFGQVAGNCAATTWMKWQNMALRLLQLRAAGL